MEIPHQAQQAVKVKNHAKAKHTIKEANAESDPECGPCAGCPKEESCNPKAPFQLPYIEPGTENPWG
jgi:hypothetical protein